MTFAAVGDRVSFLEGQPSRDPPRDAARYFNELLMEVNLVFSLVPRPSTMLMIASEMPAAIKPYSMAVAPVSSLKNFKSNRIGIPQFLSKHLLDRNAGFSRGPLCFRAAALIAA
jgi:hypothetical protein